MSGGAFDYKQYEIGYIADKIERIIEKSGRKLNKKELEKESRWREPDWYKQYPEDLYHYKYPKEVIAEFKKAVKILRKAQIYAQRIDWLLSGDDGKESFLARLKEELKENKL